MCFPIRPNEFLQSLTVSAKYPGVNVNPVRRGGLKTLNERRTSLAITGQSKCTF
jgi:hypothetical protein